LGTFTESRVTKFVVLSDSQGQTGLMPFAFTGQGVEGGY